MRTFEVLLLLVGVPVADVDDPDEPRSAVAVQAALEQEPALCVQRRVNVAYPLVVPLLQWPSPQELESAHTPPPAF